MVGRDGEGDGNGEKGAGKGGVALIVEEGGNDVAKRGHHVLILVGEQLGKSVVREKESGRNY
jgi:hypothetical protein